MVNNVGLQRRVLLLSKLLISVIYIGKHIISFHILPFLKMSLYCNMHAYVEYTVYYTSCFVNKV